jgi:cytochrome c-type biogenesis protein CcmH
LHDRFLAQAGIKRSWAMHAWLWAPACAGVLAALTAPALADSDLPPAPYADVQLPDATQEAKAKALMETLRCLVCQGQSIADSNAELAGDMRSLVRQRILAGDRPEAVRAYLIRRYGDWVSYAPPLDRSTWLLWGAPALFLLVGVGIAAGSLRRRR